MAERKPMRLVFGETLCDLSGEFPNMVVLDADVSSSTQTKLFGQKHSGRFFNFGIAEANMVSAAAGMATCGLIPVVSTFAFLLALRTADQVRSQIAYDALNVKIAGGYAGLSDHADGASHQSVMDLAILRAMPNITILVPSDIETTRGAVRAMLEHDGPVYMRLSRAEVGSHHGGDEGFETGRACVLREGSDVTIAVCGPLVGEALAAADELAQRGVSASVVEFATLKPLDTETLVRLARRTGAVVTVEEHSVIGGLGSAVAQALSETAPVPVLRVGIPDTFGQSGAYDEILAAAGLDRAHIVCQAEKAIALKEKGTPRASAD